MRTGALKRHKGILICLLLLLVAGWYFWSRREDFRELLVFSPWDLIALAGLNLVTRVLIGARLKFLTSPFGVKVGLVEGTGLGLIQGYGNVIAIKGGTAGIAYYLYRAKNFSIDRFLSIIGGGFVVTAFTAGLAGLLGVFVMSLMGLKAVPEIVLFFVFILIGALGLIIFPRVKLPSSRATNFINKVAEGWYMLRERRLAVLRLAAVELCILGSFALRYWVAFQAFSQPIRLSQSFLLAPPAYLSFIVNVTPAGMGVREPLLAYMSGILGYAVKGGLGAAVLDSAVMALLMLVLGPIAASVLMPRKSEEYETA